MEHFGLYGKNKESRYLSGEDVASKLGLDLPMHMKDEWGVDMGEVPGTDTKSDRELTRTDTDRHGPTRTGA